MTFRCNGRQCERVLRLAGAMVFVLTLMVAVLLWIRWQALVKTINPAPVPRATVRAADISPRLMLPLLADRPPRLQTLAALQANDARTAYVLLKWDLTTPPSRRLSLLRQSIGMPNVPPAMRMNEAHWMYLTAVLAPGLDDAARLDVLLFLLPLWEQWGQARALDATAHSIKAILSTSPRLNVDQRSQALATLRRAGIDTADVRAPHSLSAPPLQPPAFPFPPPPPSFPSDVFRARQERRVRAQALAANPGDARARALLAAALRAEDLARENFYEHALASTPTPYDHMALAWDQVQWRTWRLMIAEQTFGLSLVPEWEERRGELEFAQIKAWERYVAAATDWAAAQPDIARADQALYELWTWVAWMGEYGLYRRYPRDQVADALLESQEKFFAHPEAVWRAWVGLNTSSRPAWYILTLPPE